jgi:FkbM family methyltransferase
MATKTEKVFDIENEKPKVHYVISPELRDAQMRAAIARIPGRIQPGEDTDEPIAIVAFGPSLNETWEEIKKFKYIISCAGAHQFLIERGIIPTWHVDADPQAHKADLIGTPHKDVEYMMASCCHPKVFDLLEGHNIKLWHVYGSNTNKNDIPNHYPRGEWILTGGSNVGLRAMVVARFLGFKNQHIFGMDCSVLEDGTTHATKHPKTPKTFRQVPFNGRTFRATDAMIEYARQFFHEVHEIHDLTVTLYGDGLVQHMAKTKLDEAYKDRDVKKIAYKSDPVISKEYVEMNRRLHEDNLSYGTSGEKRVDMVVKLAKSINTTSVLDYGCGKGTLAKKMPYPIWEYDPAVPGKDEAARPADLVVCTDVLEHIEPELLPNVLFDLARVTKEIGYFVVHTGPAQKFLTDGRNAHLIQGGADWWSKKLSKYFEVAKTIVSGAELHIVVAPRTAKKTKPAPAPVVEAVKQPAPPKQERAEVQSVKHRGVNILYATPNDVTSARVKTIFTKEPITIEWLNSMKPGEIMIDIGANVGMYTIFAAVTKRVRVFAFEPESQNYAILNQNIKLNNVNKYVTAYPLAMSNTRGFSKLNLSQFIAGGSCHTVGQETDHNLNPSKTAYKQGAYTITLNDILELGVPAPHHIKLDVDGIEHLIIQGGDLILPNVQSLLIETNQNLSEHMGMVSTLEGLGFTYDKKQVQEAERKAGAFKGVAEYVFRRS